MANYPAERSGSSVSSLGKRVVAWVIVAAVAVIALKIVIGAVMGVITIVAVLAVIGAVIWAFRHL
jgi:hypothetical protein